MSMFDLRGGSGNGNGWNYSDNTKPNYMEAIEGTVVEISNPQSVNFATKQPEFWDDGNPKRNLCVTVKGRSGRELNWIFSPRSAASEACLVALDPNGQRQHVSIEEMLGKFVCIQTQAGVYNRQHPRPWWVTIQGEGDAASVRGIKDLSQPQANVAPAQQAPRAQAPQPVQQPAPNNIQYAQAQAAQALGYQQAPQAPANQVPYEEDPTGGYYSEDIPF